MKRMPSAESRLCTVVVRVTTSWRHRIDDLVGRRPADQAEDHRQHDDDADQEEEDDRGMRDLVPDPLDGGQEGVERPRPTEPPPASRPWPHSPCRPVQPPSTAHFSLGVKGLGRSVVASVQPPQLRRQAICATSRTWPTTRRRRADGVRGTALSDIWIVFAHHRRRHRPLRLGPPAGDRRLHRLRHVALGDRRAHAQPEPRRLRRSRRRSSSPRSSSSARRSRRPASPPGPARS